VKHIDYLVQIAQDVGEMKGTMTALDEKLDTHTEVQSDHETRLRAVETGRARLLGALAVAAPLAGATGAFLFKTFGGS
jgi:hypothetical protein